MHVNNEFNIINIGSGNEYTIKYLAEIIAKVVGFKGKIVCDKKKPVKMMAPFATNFSNHSIAVRIQINYFFIWIIQFWYGLETDQ